MAKKFYFTVFQHEFDDAKGRGTSTREYSGDTHPFRLKENLIQQGVFKSAVIIFFKEISKAEFLLFKKMQVVPRPGGN